MASREFEFRCVSKYYSQQPALKDVSLSLLSGRHTAILGPSGCGKSTALRLLAGLEAPSSGRIHLDGELISSEDRILKPPHQRGLAMVFQDLALWPNLRVLDNVLLGLSGQSMSRREMRDRALEALRLCHIESLADRKPGTLSGGQQQRVALARAMAVKPDFLLLDEPFAGLDVVTKLRLFEEIERLVAGRKITVVLVSHDPLEAKALCQSAVVLKNGRVEEQGLLDELLSEPDSEILQVFREYLKGAPLPPRDGPW
jgi:ABC-type Fe3+/spermidine/putrescine transport system ATPase subunit